MNTNISVNGGVCESWSINNNNNNNNNPSMVSFVGLESSNYKQYFKDNTNHNNHDTFMSQHHQNPSPNIFDFTTLSTSLSSPQLLTSNFTHPSQFLDYPSQDFLKKEESHQQVPCYQDHHFMPSTFEGLGTSTTTTPTSSTTTTTTTNTFSSYFDVISTSSSNNVGSSTGGRIGLNLGHRTYFSSRETALIDRLFRRPRGFYQGHFHHHHHHHNQIPRCQAEGCKVDLSNAKHYHRRHKVCELHSKATKVVAAGLDQRFCQQCSRFHVLTEFDQAKRSCRKRLADHNRRRRKTTTHNSSSQSSTSSPPPPTPTPTTTTTTAAATTTLVRHKSDISQNASCSTTSATASTTTTTIASPRDHQQHHHHHHGQTNQGPSFVYNQMVDSSPSSPPPTDFFHINFQHNCHNRDHPLFSGSSTDGNGDGGSEQSHHSEELQNLMHLSSEFEHCPYQCA